VNFTYGGQNALPATGAIKQGFIEQSTVNVVEEMAAMISGFRAFEANMQAIRAQDAALQRATQQVGRATPR
jgi:flagellar basal-body rod protein FlgG